MIGLLTEDFLAGSMVGFIAGLIIIDAIWYIYWKHVMDPMLKYHLKPMWQEKGGS